ncbi:MAG: Glycerate kinase [Arthrobacter sp.]|nr:Glycerate kinase [Arthrobacter sp.]
MPLRADFAVRGRDGGIDVVLDFTGLAGCLTGAELVITGEGSLDEQKRAGQKAARRCAGGGARGHPVIAVCGRTTLGPERLRTAGFREVHALTEFESNVDTCIAEAGPLLERLGRNLGARLTELAARPTRRKQGDPQCLM